MEKYPSFKPPKNVSLSTYRKRKLKELRRDFCIKITEAEEAHAYELKTEVAIDQFCLSMINKYWG